jgi:endonuclease-3
MKKGPPLATVLRELKKLYPDAHCTLDWTTPLELLVATILAAQCTDARVNMVTKTLFKKYRKPQDYLAVSQEELERDIHSCGTFHMKAKAIQTTCRRIIDVYDGKVPRTMKDMLTLLGVGRKTAAVVLGTAYDVTEGIPIDTHNIRVLRRLGLTKEKTQARIELDMMKKTPRKDWLKLSHLMVAHGRAICHARNPECEKCVFRHTCPSSRLHSKAKKA